MAPVPNPQDVLPPWGAAMAGAAGSVFANTLVYPLDLVKTKLQVQMKKQANSDPAHVHYEGTAHAIVEIMKEEGIVGLYSGITSSLIGVASTNFAYFYWYSVVRTLYNKSSQTAGPSGTAVELSLGAVAGALAQLFTLPVAVVCTRQQTQHKSERKGMLETAKEIIDGEDGYSGLWRGLKASLVLVINPSITYGAYQRLRDVFFAGKNNLQPWEAFVLGAASKALATIATQPLIVAKVRLQSKPPPERKEKPFKSFTEIIAYTLKHEGFLALFRGIGPQIVKGILVQGILMMTKERIELFAVLLFRYFRQLKQQRLSKLAERAAEATKSVAPVVLQ